MTFTRRIKGTVYQVHVCLDTNDDASMEDRLIRMIVNEVSMMSMRKDDTKSEASKSSQSEKRRTKD